MGAELRRAGALPAHLHAAIAAQARGRPDAAEVFVDRNRRRLPAGRVKFR